MDKAHSHFAFGRHPPDDGTLLAHALQLPSSWGSQGVAIRSLWYQNAASYSHPENRGGVVSSMAKIGRGNQLESEAKASTTGRPAKS